MQTTSASASFRCDLCLLPDPRHMGDCPRQIPRSDTKGDKLSKSHNEGRLSFDGMHPKENLGKQTYLQKLMSGEFVFEDYKKPSAIKGRVIKTLPEAVGKTTTFCIGILRQLDLNTLKCQALVLTPDEGSVKKIIELIEFLGWFLGVKVRGCVDVWKVQSHVVVGRPRDMLIMLRRNRCHDHIKMFVLDNADVMLQDEHLKNKIDKIFQHLPSNVQVGVSSEMMAAKDLKSTCRPMHEPVKTIVTCELTLNGIKHFCTPFHEEREKKDEICILLPMLEKTKCVIFVNSREKLIYLSNLIASKGYRFCSIIPEMHQVVREFVLQSFWSGGSGIVITNLEARGFEFDACFIINYDLPTRVDTYIRRVGRRKGKGFAINFSTMYDWYKLLDIQRMYEMNFNFCPSNGGLSQIVSDEAVEGCSTRLDNEGDVLHKFYEEVRGTFDSMDLEEYLVKGISEYGYANPPNILQRCIEPLCKGSNVVVQAYNEPGRTVTFCTWILQKLDYSSGCQCVVLTPNFWFAEDIVYVMRELGRFREGLKVQVVIGDENFPRQKVKHLKNGVHVFVGDPLSVLAFLERETTNSGIKMCVLDEVSRLLECGTHRVRKVFELLPPTVQVGVFLERMSPLVAALTRQFVHDPFGIVMEQDKVNLEGIKHFVVNVKQSELKLDALKSFFQKVTMGRSCDVNCVIFMNSYDCACFIAKELGVNKKLSVVVLPRLMNWNHREGIMRRFQDGDINVVIIVRPMDRGFEFAASLVINYDVPHRAEFYIKSVGRFGRQAVITFGTDDDWYWFVKEFLSKCHLDFEKLPTDFAYLLLKRLKVQSKEPTQKMQKLELSIEEWG